MDGQEHHQHTGNIIISTSVSDTGIPEPCEPTVRLALRSFTTTPSTSSRTPACMLLCSNRHWFTVAADVKSSTGKLAGLGSSAGWKLGHAPGTTWAPGVLPECSNLKSKRVKLTQS